MNIKSVDLTLGDRDFVEALERLEKLGASSRAATLERVQKVQGRLYEEAVRIFARLDPYSSE